MVVALEWAGGLLLRSRGWNFEPDKAHNARARAKVRLGRRPKSASKINFAA
jgi:hypothetical protein